jgi:chloramphenicol 3-O phosphotransferase
MKNYFLFSMGFIFMHVSCLMPTIIILNGTSSAGKTTLARALQEQLADAYLYLGIDTFIEMLPERFEGFGTQANQGIQFIKDTTSEGEPIVRVSTGLVGKRLMSGMYDAIVALAVHGNNLIIDEVIFTSEAFSMYKKLLEPYNVYFIGVHAPLDVVVKREIDRGDRQVGLARWLYDKVHKDKIYDFEVDTSQATPEECAQQIIEYIKNNPLDSSTSSRLRQGFAGHAE